MGHFNKSIQPLLAIFRCTVAEEINSCKYDPRGIKERIRTQNICHEAFEHRLRLWRGKKILVCVLFIYFTTYYTMIPQSLFCLTPSLLSESLVEELRWLVNVCLTLNSRP